MAGVMMVSNACRGEEGVGRRAREEEEQDSQLSLIALLLAALRRSVVACRVDRQKDVISAAVNKMEIGWPTDVRHVTHVTFDRFNGFLGLPVEFEVEIPCRVPSASASVFAVSPESMQCCYDSKGNSVPTILLLMQERLYAQGGLKAEGIFRINPENSQEEHVRDQLNKGIVPDDIDVHCLAGLIKAWFRELPEGVLDCLSPEQVLDCNTEEECVELVNLLLPTQTALLNWAVDLMADVVEEEDVNKMSARNIAMVFAPNMTQMSDPLTALMHAVQVMNFLKTLILKTLREREEASTEGYTPFSRSPWSDQQSDDDMGDSPRGVVDMMSGGERRSDYSDHDAEYSPDDDVDDRHVSYCHSMVDEADSVEEIQECFLRHLELNVENGEAAAAVVVVVLAGGEPIRGDDDALVVHAGDGEATQVSSGEPNATTTSVPGSSMSTSSTSDEDWEGSFSTGGAVPNSKSSPPSKQLENGHDEEAVLKCQQKQNS